MIIRGHHHGLGKMRNESATVSAFLIVVTNTAVTAPLSLSIQTACSQLAVSELTAEGTQRALRGTQRALRGHSEGTQRALT